jgi:light-regulated signal transduction histidine kinase (bacteriophytochrome)
MISTIRSFHQQPQQQQPNNFSMSPQLNQQYQSIFNQCINLKKEYDSTADEDLKNALRVVLNKKIEQLQSLTASYTSTINVQLQRITPQ